MHLCFFQLIKNLILKDLVNNSKPVILEEFELSGSNNHLVFQNKVDMNDTTQKRGIKAMINAELTLNRDETQRNRLYRLKPVKSSTSATRNLYGKNTATRIFIK